MEIRHNNARITKPSDLNMDNLGDLPVKVAKLYESSLRFDGIEPFDSNVRGATKVNKKELAKGMKILIDKRLTSLSTLQGELEDYFKSKSSDKSNSDAMYAKIKVDKDKIPYVKVTNSWSYLMGKKGKTTAAFQTLKKVDYFDGDSNDYLINEAGFEFPINSSVAKPIDKLPKFNSLVVGNFMPMLGPDAPRYMAMRSTDIVNYLSQTENQTFYLYKL